MERIDKAGVTIAAALVALLALSGCAGAGQFADGAGLEGEPVDSALGSYLAGRFARSERDTAAAADFYEDALGEDPDNLALLQRAFLATLAEGRMDRAVELAGRRPEGETRGVISEMVLAVHDIRERRYEQARARLQEKDQGGFGSMLRPIALAWVEAGLGGAGAAVAALGAVEERSAFSAFRSFHSALIGDFLGMPEAADKAYRETRDGGSAPIRVLLAHASFLSRNGRGEEAAKLLDEQLERLPENAVLRHVRREIQAGRPLEPLIRTPAEGVAEAFFGAAGALAQDRTADAARVYVRMALHLRPGFDVAQLLLGDLLDNDKRWPEAIEAFRAVPAASPHSWEARLRIANSLSRQEKFDDSAALLRAMSEERPDDTAALVALADLLRGRERFEQAAEVYERALLRVEGELQERHWPLLYARGIAFERSKAWDRAEADFLTALKLKPDQPLVLNYLGYSWVEQGKNLERAREMIERAVAQRPNDGYIVDSLGWVLYRMGDFAGAVRHLERAVELRPEDPTINEHLGDAYWRVDRRLEARFQWRHALALGPDKDRIDEIVLKIDNGLSTREARNGG